MKPFSDNVKVPVQLFGMAVTVFAAWKSTFADISQHAAISCTYAVAFVAALVHNIIAYGAPPRRNRLKCGRTLAAFGIILLAAPILGWTYGLFINRPIMACALPMPAYVGFQILTMMFTKVRGTHDYQQPIRENDV